MKTILRWAWPLIFCSRISCFAGSPSQSRLNSSLTTADDTWSGFYEAEHLAYIQAVTRPLIESDFRKLMWPFLNTDEQKILRGVTLSFPKEDGASLMNFYANNQGGRKTIVLPQSALLFLNDLCLASAYLNRKNLNEGLISQYLSIVRYQWPAIKYQSYRPLNALGIDREKALTDPDVSSLFAKLYSTAIWFILAHEMGHLLLNHPGYEGVSPALARIHEREADQFALTFLQRVGDQPYEGIVLFFWISQHFSPFVEDDTNYQYKATHPLTAERVGTIASHLKNNAGWYARSQSNPVYFEQLFEQTARKMETLGNMLKDSGMWQIVMVMGQSGRIDQLTVHRSGAPVSTEIGKDRRPFVGSFRGYWSNSNQGRLLMSLRLDSRQGAIRGTGSMRGTNADRHNLPVPWIISNGIVDGATLHFSWRMSDSYFGKGKLVRTGQNLAGSWWTVQDYGNQQVGKLFFSTIDN